MPNKQNRQKYNQNKDVVAQSEMNARYFKAEYETMYYTLKLEEIRPEYEKFLRARHPEVVEAIEGKSENLESTTENADTEKQEG